MQTSYTNRLNVQLCELKRPESLHPRNGRFTMIMRKDGESRAKRNVETTGIRISMEFSNLLLLISENVKEVPYSVIYKNDLSYKCYITLKDSRKILNEEEISILKNCCKKVCDLTVKFFHDLSTFNILIDETERKDKSNAITNQRFTFELPKESSREFTESFPLFLIDLCRLHERDSSCPKYALDFRGAITPKKITLNMKCKTAKYDKVMNVFREKLNLFNQFEEFAN